MSKDWFLVAISPWYKWFYNPKTGETKHVEKEK